MNSTYSQISSNVPAPRNLPQIDERCQVLKRVDKKFVYLKCLKVNSLRGRVGLQLEITSDTHVNKERKTTDIYMHRQKGSRNAGLKLPWFVPVWQTFMKEENGYQSVARPWLFQTRGHQAINRA